MSNTNVSYSSDTDNDGAKAKRKDSMASTKHGTAMRATAGSIQVTEEKGGVSVVVVADSVTMTQHFHF